MNLKDKIVIVTGGGRGIGKGIARRMVKEGARVTIAQRDEANAQDTVEELRQGGGTADFVKTDVSKADEVQNMVDFVVSRYGGLDVLVNNAGITGAEGSVLDLPVEKWQRMIDINLTSVFLCSQAAARVMVADGKGGRIINIASICSFRAQPKACNYVATKGAIPLLTMAMALDLSQYGIIVNAVAPGTISTERTGPRLKNRDYREMIGRSVPVGRTGSVDEIAAVAAFLASDEVGYVQGQTIIADGGLLAQFRLD